MIVLVGVMGKCRVGLQIIDPIIAAAAITLMAEDVLCSLISQDRTEEGFLLWRAHSQRAVPAGKQQK